MMAVSVPNTIETPSAANLSLRPYQILRFLLLLSTPCASSRLGGNREGKAMKLVDLVRTHMP